MTKVSTESSKRMNFLQRWRYMQPPISVPPWVSGYAIEPAHNLKVVGSNPTPVTKVSH